MREIYLFQGDDDFFVLVVIFNFDQGAVCVGVIGELDDFVEVDAFCMQGFSRLPGDELGGDF